jgi:uncharacterized spore protein YtfJ
VNAVDTCSITASFLPTRPSAVTFNFAAGDRLANKAAVPVTLAFKTTTALTTGGKITLNYPAGLFAATPNPANNGAGSTSVATMTATSDTTGNSIVVTTAVIGIASDTTFTITLSGLTMGAATAVSPTGIIVSTDADTVASTGAASGVIGGAPLHPSCTIQASDRVAGKKPVLATFGFAPTAGGWFGFNGVITLNYSSRFFVSGAHISAVSQGITLNTATSGVSFTAVTVVAGTIASPNAIIITLTRFTMGAAYAGGNVTVQTSAYAIPSYPPLFSGCIDVLLS